MHGRMFAPETTDPCAAGEQVCDAAFEWTGSSTAADIADVVIGKPLALTGLLLLGLVLRWVLHRVVDRVVRRAEAGVLPDKVGRFSICLLYTSDAADE